MLWYAAALVVLFATSVIALMAAGAVPQPGVQSLAHTSLRERRVYRRSACLQAVGFTSLAMAVLLGLFGVAAGMAMLH